MLYGVRNGAARCRQGVSSVALAIHCLGGGNATGAEEVVVHCSLIPVVRGRALEILEPDTSDMAEPCTHASDMAVEWCW